MWLARLVVFSLLACSTARESRAAADEPQRYTFTSGEYIISMDVRFSDPYVTKRLAYYNDRTPRKEICLVGNGETGACPDRFTGAVATVTFTVKRARGKLRGKTTIREYVAVVAQSPDLPPRPPFDKTQVLTNGVISDLQAFGYDEGDVAEGDREAEREQAKERLWRICRQELYLNGETVPFAIISWRYTLQKIEILQVQGGLGKTEVVQQRDQQAQGASGLAWLEAEQELVTDALEPTDGLIRRGTFSMKFGDYDAARTAYERLLVIYQEAFGPDHPLVGITLTNIAMIHQLQQHYGAAEPLYRRSLRILEKTVGPDDANTAVAELGMAKLFCAQRRNGEAETLLESAIPVLEHANQPGDPNLAIALVDLAEAYRLDGRYSKAEPFYQRALAIIQGQVSLDTSEIHLGLEHYAQMLRKTKRKEQAHEIEALIKTLVPQ
jgi:tetratricopeptide (TPR) repeat protein